MKTPLLLAANWDELIGFAVGVVTLLVWLAKQFSDAKKGAPAVQPAVPPQPRPPRQEPMAEAAPPADPLRAQIDEFLRRANQQAQQPVDGPAQGQAAAGMPRQPSREEIVVLLDEAPPEPRRDSRTPTLQPAAAQVPHRPRREKKPKGLRSQSVAEHVAERVGIATQQMREEVANLGERVIQADKQFDVQLQQKFDHQLGSLAERPGATAYDQQTVASGPSPATQIAALLASPEGVRQAVLLNEILRRPEDRR